MNIGYRYRDTKDTTLYQTMAEFVVNRDLLDTTMEVYVNGPEEFSVPLVQRLKDLAEDTPR